MLMRALYPLRATSYLVLVPSGSTWADCGPHCTPFQHMGLALTEPAAHGPIVALTAPPFSTWAWPSLNPFPATGTSPPRRSAFGHTTH